MRFKLPTNPFLQATQRDYYPPQQGRQKQKKHEAISLAPSQIVALPFL
jgi:hypothetical protein